MDRLRVDEKDEPERPAPASAPPAPDLLQLQRSAGNAAVARMIARDALALPGAPAAKPFSPFGVDLGTSGMMDDYYSAMDAVTAWFDGVAKGAIVQSVPELVAAARELTVKTRSGQVKPVSEVVIQAADVERTIRERAKTRGVKLLEHQSVSDPKAAEAEALAVLKNLGAKIPDGISFGGDDAKITIGMGGTVKGELKAGSAKIEAEGGAEGGSASVKVPGAKVGVGVDDKGFKLDLKAGDLVTVKGSVKRSGEDWEWRADLQIGTLGKVITPDEIAKVMKGAQDTFGNGARDLAAGVSAEKVKAHGGSVKEAVEGVVEKASKSAAQAKSGWQLGVGVAGKDGGVSASVTLTWVF